MDEQSLLQFFSSYGYVAIFVLMVAEGPGATMLAAFLAAAGFFNVYIVFFLSVFGDVVGDVLLYGAGRKWGMGFVRTVGKHIGITESLVLKMGEYFRRHGGKTIFAVKSTTGLCWATFTAAGIVKMPFKKFVGYSFLGGLVWSGMLTAAGYFFGNVWQTLSQYIAYAGWIVGVVAVLIFIMVTLYKRRQGSKIFTKEGV